MAVPRVVVGFDIGSAFGWAVLVGGEHARSGTAHFPFGKGNRRRRFMAARDHIESVLRGALELADGFADDVMAVYELIKWFSGPDWSAVYYGIAAFIGELTIRLGVACKGLVPTRWKKTAVGHGNASKPDYIAAAAERYGLDLGDENEDEAAGLGLAYAALVELGGPVRLVSGQQGGLAL